MAAGTSQCVETNKKNPSEQVFLSSESWNQIFLQTDGKWEAAGFSLEESLSSAVDEMFVQMRLESLPLWMCR